MFNTHMQSSTLERIFNVLNAYAALYPEAEHAIDLVIAEIKIIAVLELETPANKDELPWN